ncbi:hypothetical protein ACFSTD_05540 [Novosphingobium colocasiae]
MLILLLFSVAALVEARSERLRKAPRMRHVAYTLALGVYCSSWTFYGAVGSAVRDGWSYLPIYLGPILLLIVAPRFLRSLSRAVAEEQAATVSDFIAARFGHDVIVARLVTIIALFRDHTLHRASVPVDRQSVFSGFRSERVGHDDGRGCGSSCRFLHPFRRAPI